MEEKFQHNAELVIQSLSQHAGRVLDYDEASVEWIDGFIERQRQRADINPDMISGLVSTLGSFLGECIRRQFGGSWKQINGQWAINFDDGNAAYPFNKVQKQFENGAEDSILSFYAVIPLLFNKS